MCNGGENSWTCSMDCGYPAPMCGDGMCNGGEDPWMCSRDCGWPPSYCGNAICEQFEDPGMCPSDCGSYPSYPLYCGIGPYYYGYPASSKGRSINSEAPPSVQFSVTFSRPVTDFDASDVTITGTAAGELVAAVEDTGDHMAYIVTVTGMESAGTVEISIGGRVAEAADGTPNLVADDSDNSIDFDNVLPAVTVEQAEDQADPTDQPSADFAVVFSEPVTGFTSDDVVVDGTTAGTAIVTVTGGPTEYNVHVVETGARSGSIRIGIASEVAQDAAGNASQTPALIDNGVVYYTKPGTPATAKLEADEADPGLVSGRVTFEGDGFFYVSSEQRTAGIRVLGVESPGLGYACSVTGHVLTNVDGERFVQAQTITPGTAGTVPPLGMPSREIGGASFITATSGGWGQSGITGARGLNSIGLLVTVWGQFTYVDSTHFTLDDGSGNPVLCEAASVEPGTGYVSATGICSCKLGPSGRTPVLLVREKKTFSTP